MALRDGRIDGLLTLVELNQLISSPFDIGAVLTGVAETVSRLMNGAFVSFWLVDERSQCLTAVATSDSRIWEDFPVQTLRLDEAGALGEVVQRRRPIKIADVSQDKRVIAPEWCQAHGLHTYLGVPVLAQDSVLAVLGLHGRFSLRLGPVERGLIEGVAAKAAVAIKNARLYQETEQRRREAQILADLVRTINASLDLDSVLRHIADGAQQLCESDIARIALLDAGSDTMMFRYWVGARYQGYHTIRLKPGKGLGGLVWETNRPARTENAIADRRITKDYAAVDRAEGIVSTLAVPIRIGDSVQGLIFVDNRYARPFSDQHETILMQLADHAAIAIKNARLFAREQAAHEQAERVAALVAAEKKLLEMVAAGVGLNDVLIAVCAAIERQSEGALASVLLLDADGARLRHAAAPSLPDGYVRAIDGIAVGPSGGALGVAAYAGKPIIVGDIAVDPRWANYRDLAQRYRLRACWGTPIFAAGGKVLGMVVIYYRTSQLPGENDNRLVERATHIAAIAIERRRAEEALRHAHNDYQQLVESAQAIVWRGDARTLRFTFVSREAETLLGYPVSRWTKNPTFWPDHLHPEDRAWAVTFSAEATAENRAHEFECRMIAADGRTVWLRNMVRVVVDRGQATELIGVMTEITDRKRAEEAARTSEARYRELFENAKDIIYTHDLTGRFTSANRAAELALGYSREETLGRTMADILAPAHLDRARQMLHRKLAEGVPATTYEVEVVAKDGRRVPLEVSDRLIYENGQPVGVQGIARDLTERQQFEEQLRQSQKMEAIGRLAGGIAHDFNNILTVITGRSGLLLKRLEPGGPIRGDVEMIEEAGNRAAALTRQLLAFGRKQVLQASILNVNVTLTNIEPMLRRLLPEDIDLLIVKGTGLGHVKADAGQLEQVVLNLAVNARDAMPAGGRLLVETANVELDEIDLRRHSGARPGPYVLLTVSDTGTGMDDETRAHIFEPFFTTKETGQGTGLGLATVYGIVEQSAGMIEVDSKPGHGSTFRIYLPRVESSAETLERVRSLPPPARGSGTILLVEDEKAVRDLAREILEQNGYTVLEAGNAAEALPICERHLGPIHLLLTDVVMPNMSGRELAERMAALRPEAKVLYMSGYTDDVIVSRGVSNSGMPFLQKPFEPDTLTRAVSELLNQPSA